MAKRKAATTNDNASTDDDFGVGFTTDTSTGSTITDAADPSDTGASGAPANGTEEPAQTSPETPPSEPEGNIPNAKFRDKASFLKATTKLGEAQGAGLLSLAEHMVNTAYATVEGVIDPGNKDDAKDAMEAFEKGATKKLGNSATGKGKGFGPRVSALRAVMKASVVTDEFPSIMERSRAVIVEEKAKGNHSLSTFEAFAALARVQCSDEQGGVPLSEDDVRDALLPKSKEKRGELGKLTGIVKALNAMIEGREPTDKNPDGVEGYPSEAARNGLEWLKRRLAEISPVAKTATADETA